MSFLFVFGFDSSSLLRLLVFPIFSLQFVLLVFCCATMSSGFQHSVKVPTQYRNLAKILKNALEGKKSLRSLIFEDKHVVSVVPFAIDGNVPPLIPTVLFRLLTQRIRGAQAVLKHYIDNRGAIEAAINKSRILEDNPRLCPSLCRILVTELFYGRKELKGDSKPVQTVRNYLGTLQELLAISNTNSGQSVESKKGTYFV